MKVHTACWLAVALVLGGCIDFGAAQTAGCQKRPELCGNPNAQDSGGTDAGLSDAGAGDGGQGADGGTNGDAGPDGGQGDAGFDAGVLGGWSLAAVVTFPATLNNIPFNAVAGASATDVWALGQGAGYARLQTGWTGEQVSSTPTSSLTGLLFRGGTTYWATGIRLGGQKSLDILNDAGWTQNWGNEGGGFNGITSSPDSGYSWLFGPCAGCKSMVYRCDAGLTDPWRKNEDDSILVSNFTPKAGWSPGGTEVWVVGDAGIIFRQPTNLALNQWQAYDSGTAEDLNAIFGTSKSDIWAVGNAGVTTHWNGTAWFPVNSGVNSTLWGLWGSSPLDYWAVGQAGTFLHWDGNGWSPVDAGIPDDVMGAWGAAANDVWAVTNDGGVLHCCN